MLTRIFGLHGSGKTAKIYEYLEKCIAEKRQSFLVVPEQNALAAERELIDKLGNPANMYVEVINFKRLCNRVFREVGGVASRVPDKITKQLAMCQALSQVKDNLAEYSRLAEYPDFAEKMLSCVERMHANRVSSEKIDGSLSTIRSQCSEILANKMHDISLASNAYSAYIENKLDFPGDLLDKLYETLCEFDFFAGKTVFFDSFYGYTAQELAIIEKIIADADDVYMTFLCKNDSAVGLKSEEFKRGTTASFACRSFAEKHAKKIFDLHLEENVKHSSPALAAIAESFSLSALSGSHEPYSSDGIAVISCENVYDECENSVKIVSELIRHGALPREIAICAASPEEYVGILDAEFEKAGIPFSFDNGETLSTSAVAGLVSSAFEVAFSWSLQSIAEYIKTGLSGLDDVHADELELYMRTWNISGKKYFCDTWYMNPDGFTESEPDTKKLAEINASKELVLSCLLPFSESIASAKTAGEIARAVYTLIKDTTSALGERATNDTELEQNLDLLYRTLDSFYETLGDEKMTAERFADLFRTAIKSVKSGKLPELIDQVRFSNVSLMRPDGVKYVLLLGANDKVFPSSPDRSDFFRDSERKQLQSLGIDIAETDEEKTYDELFLAYTALCSATDKAFVLYRRYDLKGDVSYKSIIISILEKMFGEKATEYTPGSTAVDYAVSDEALFEYYLTQKASSEKTALREYFLSNADYRERILSAERADETATPLSDDTRSLLFGENMTSSYSRIEKYRECPFKYFCTYTLKLTPEPKAELGSIEIGNTVHKILEELIPEFVRRQNDGGDLSDEYVKSAVKQKLDEMLSRFASGNPEAVTRRFEYMFSRLAKSVNALCLEVVKELKQSEFVPTDFELRLAFDGDVPPVTSKLSDGRRLSVVGAIDRVDVYKSRKTGESWVRITDYKTGSKEFRIEDAKEGFNLQMLLYLYALTANETPKYGKLKPAGVIYRIVTPPDKKEDSFGKASSPDYAETEIGGGVSGIVVDDEDTLHAMEASFDKKARFIPVSVSRGELKGAVSLDSLVTLLEDAVKKATELAEGISLGNKCQEPFIDSRRNACNYCDYKEICRSDRSDKSR